MAHDNNKFLNDSGKAGLVLGGVAIAYYIITVLLGKAGSGFLVSLLSAVLWAAKLVLCIWLLNSALKRYAASEGADRGRTFRFGMSVAACSALVYAAFCLIYVRNIDPSYFSEMFGRLAEVYSSMLTSDQMDQLLNMESSMPVISFWGNLIWCWLYGTIVSAICAGRIFRPSDPFSNNE